MSGNYIRIYKEAVTYLKTVSWHFPDQSEVKHEIKSNIAGNQLGFESRSS
jgi:hypothetical protein